MKIGYPCVNLGIGCTSSSTFRLSSYSERRLIEAVKSNLNCLERVLDFNIRHGILFFRITSDMVPFASHPVCNYDWGGHFQSRLEIIGETIRKHQVRISMHPDQFVVINARDRGVFERSVKELEYHAKVLDLMGLDTTAKLQLHVGGVYGDKVGSMRRFEERYTTLPDHVRKRLVIENDDVSYSLSDCMEISAATGAPVLFDSFHHSLNSNGESVGEAFRLFTKTWRKNDGIPMVDYSSQDPGQKSGKHSKTIDKVEFMAFLKATVPYDFDLMLEIKDKENSALRALRAATGDMRLASAVKEENP